MLGIKSVVRKVVGTQNDRELKRLQPLVVKINELESQFKPLTQAQLQGKTAEFKERLSRGESLDSLLPEAFATVREASIRVLGMRHFDVQLIGGMTLHRGRIAEMKTGEGKTLVATLPVYLNALEGRGAHVITVNDYLARRDSEWMGQLYGYLGMDTGIIVHGLNDRQRQKNYKADITYGTNNEFGFDYLRDNMKFRLEDYVQRELHYAIVDEVDSILIDEARTPLIISGPAEASTELYYKIDKELRAAKLRKDEDYTVDEKTKTAVLTEQGVEKMEQALHVDNLYDPVHIETLHHVNQALRAHMLFKIDVDYVVRDGEVLIVDEFTGRLMPGRRWSDGLHQAIEAKEGVTIENENQTLATITFQNYFRMYNKLSGMTGTADTEATEFQQIYKLDVTVVPTNKPLARIDHPDVIFKSEDAKFKAIADEIKGLHDKGQPVLVGTISIEKSEKLGHLLKGLGIRHNVLNAKQHEREAEIVAQAGRSGTVTIATNMAGRGTDIVLGGNPEKMAEAEVGDLPASATEEEKKEHATQLAAALERHKESCAAEKEKVKEAGGLYILGTERHESRRIDNQLRGRSGRQGDVGGSRFYLSLDDDLMRIFGSVNIKRFMEDDLPIEHKLINRAIENAQKKVEGHNYDIRKHLLKYDDVMNEQRKVVYSWRREVLAREGLKDMVFSMIEELAGQLATEFFPGGRLKKTTDGQRLLDVKELNEAMGVTFHFRTHIEEKDVDPFNDRGLRDLIVRLAQEAYSRKEQELGEENMRHLERMILLTTIDHLWKDHLLAMDHLREGIGLQGYGQKDPLVEYKKEGFRFFEMMMNQINADSIQKLFTVQATRDMHLEDLDFDESQPMEYNLNSDGELTGGLNLPGIQPAGIPGGQLPPGGGPFPGMDPRMAGGGGGVLPGLGQPMGAFPGGGGRAPSPLKPVTSAADKVGRNDPCPCGSGKKYKKCHGA